MKLKRIIAFILLIVFATTLPALAVSENAKKVVLIAKEQLGKPYALSSDAPHSFNCATLVMYCFNKVKSGTITTSGIHCDYRKINSMKALEPGDIVCYRISRGRWPEILNYHFGIYCGKGYFIHAKTDEGVVCTKVSRYDGHFLGGIRLY